MKPPCVPVAADSPRVCTWFHPGSVPSRHSSRKTSTGPSTQQPVLPSPALDQPQAGLSCPHAHRPAPPLSYSLRHLSTIRQRVDTNSDDPWQLGFRSWLSSELHGSGPNGLVGQLSHRVAVRGRARTRVRRSLQAEGGQDRSHRHLCSRGWLRARRGILFSPLPARSAVPQLLGVELGWCWHGGPHIQSETSGFAA